MNFLKTKFLCTVLKTAILIIYIHERNWNSHALMFSFKTCKLLCACLYSKSRLTNYNLSLPHNYQGPEHIRHYDQKSCHVMSYENPTYSGCSLIYRTRKPLSNIATVSTSLEHAFILFKFLQDQK